MDQTKLMMAVAVVLIGALFLVAGGDLAPKQENRNYGGMMDRYRLNTHAQRVCRTAAQGKLENALYTPTDIAGDGGTYAEIHWIDASHTVFCRYESSRGVTRLKIDDRDFGAVSVDLSEDPATRAPGAGAEKHWGHW